MQYCGSALVSVEIQIQNLGQCGSGSRDLMTKYLKKFTADSKCNLLIPRSPLKTSIIQEKSSTLKREYTALQNMICLLFLFFRILPTKITKSVQIHAEADPDP